MKGWRAAGLIGGVVVFVALALAPTGLERRAAYAAGVSGLMAVWWLGEVLPIAWTACLPLLLFPSLDVFGRGVGGSFLATAAAYVDAYIFLFLGGMVIGAAMEQWGLHRRVALHIMRAVGTEPKRLLLGVLLATAAVSMWISNTATAVMMLPIAMALIAQLEAAAGRRLSSFGASLALAVAYASNVGGIGTKIGTGTNSIFCGYLSEKLHVEISFVKYIAIGTPFVMLFLPVVWAALWRVGRHDAVGDGQGKAVIEKELAAMGSMSRGERKVAAVFAAAATLWILGDLVRAALPWKLLGKQYEAGVAMGAAAALVALRAVGVRALMRVPWSTLVLLGGSFAMAAGIEGSGLSRWMALQMAGLQALPLIAQLGIASAASVALSAVASNTATVNVLLNVLPRSLPVLTVTAVGSSCDFMLPAGTPPNAIVFGSGYIRLPTMIRTGFILDCAAVALLTVYGRLWLAWLMR